MDVKAGSRWESTVCDTEVMVVRPPTEPVDLRCGGATMQVHGSGRRGIGTVDAAFSDGSLIGKRYIDESTELEVLCTKSGAGSLSIGNKTLVLKSAKPLPASD